VAVTAIGEFVPHNFVNSFYLAQEATIYMGFFTLVQYNTLIAQKWCNHPGNLNNLVLIV